MPRQRKLPEGIKRRNGEYYCDFYSGGRRVRRRLSGDLDVAAQLLNELKARADRAEFGILDNDFPLADLKAKYLRHCRQALRPSTCYRYEVCLDAILPRIGANRVSQLTIDNAIRYREERLCEGLSERTVNMQVGALSGMLNWAVEVDESIQRNPLVRLKPLKHDNPKEGRALSNDEVRRLLESSPPHWADIWRAFLLTGMRKEELASLTFRDIDWNGDAVVVRRRVAKNHTERRIPIHRDLRPILERQIAECGDRARGTAKTAKIEVVVKARFTQEHVFVTTQNTPLSHRSGLYHAFIRCCRLARIETRTLRPDGKEIDHVDLHSLRRTFATVLLESGANPKVVQKLLGHKTLAMTMGIYAKVREQSEHQAIGRLSYGGDSLPAGHVVAYPGGAS